MEAATWVPASWGGHGVVPSGGDEIISFECTTAVGHHHSSTGIRVDGSSVIDDSDEEMEPFEMERFVDRLVEDEPPSWRGGRAGGGGCGGFEDVWEPTNRAAVGAANLFLKPIYDDWQEQQLLQQQRQQQHPRPLLGGAPRCVAHQQLTNHAGPMVVPQVVPQDPILDTPCRAIPEILPSVTLGLVRKGGGGEGGRKNGIAGFEPGLIYNIPSPTNAYSACLQVPMAPLRQPFVGRSRVELYSPAGGCDGSSSSSYRVIVQSGERFATYLNERSNNIPGNVSAAAAANNPAPLTGADAHSSLEYDDERHAFLRRQEVAVPVGRGYLLTGIVTPKKRAATVDWLSGLHSAAPSASGGGAEPLSLETLFLAINLLDRFLSTAEGRRAAVGSGGYGGAGPGPGLKLAGAACLALASKYQDTQAASLWGLAVASTSSTLTSAKPLRFGGGGGVDGGPGVDVGMSGGGDVFGALGADSDVHAARKELAAMEMRVASTLGFRLTVPTAISFLGVFLRRAAALGYLPADAPSAIRVRQEAQQILVCVVRHASSLDHPPSALAAAALYWASCITAPGAAPPTAFAFFAVTGYELELLCRCLRDMEIVRTGGSGGRREAGLPGTGGGGVAGRAGGGDFLFGSAALPEHAGNSLFGAGGGHPAIAAL